MGFDGGYSIIKKGNLEACFGFLEWDGKDWEKIIRGFC